MTEAALLLEGLRRCFHRVRRLFYRFRRFWRSVYYAVTNALIIIGCAAVLAGVWYLCFVL